jgi:hypothetical protein
MTRVILDAATVEKLHGLSESLELCDEAGNVFGRFVPDETSPAFRQWLKNLDPGISNEEMQRRAERARTDGLSTEQVLQRLRSRQP